MYGKAETPRNCFCRGFSRIFERVSMALKGNQNAITADLPRAHGHQNIARTQCTGIGERQSSCISASGPPPAFLLQEGINAERAGTDTQTRHAGACQQQGLREKKDQTASSSAVALLMYLPGFSSKVFSFLCLLSPNGNNTDSVPYFITSVFSS